MARGAVTLAAPTGRVVTALGLLLAPLLLAGCTSMSLDLPYYWQSVRGHLEMMGQARPIAQVLADPITDPRLAGRLRRAAQIRAFASRELALPDNGSFTRYADLKRPFVVWNVFATPELSMTLEQWCFPVAGCVGYRGYFDRDAAESFARQLRAQGLEAHVAGVPAYSTLGWFDDPVLNTFIHQPEGELARVLFHELAHQRVYAAGDTAFNESFATAVEQAGVERWLRSVGDPDLRAQYQTFAGRRRQFVALLIRHRDALAAVYAEPTATDEQRRDGKARVFAELRSGYEALKADWAGYAGYDRWFAQPLTNAHLASVSAYNRWVPVFERMLAERGGDFARFYDDVGALAALPPVERARSLAATGAPEQHARSLAATGGPEQHAPSLAATGGPEQRVPRIAGTGAPGQ